MDEPVNPRQSFLTIDGVRLCIIETGKGKPLLLIHGLGGPLMWQKVIEPLSRSFHVIIPHLPGYGESEGAGKQYSAREHAAICSNILSSLNIAKADIAGISYGGQVATHIAADFPAQTEKLILCCSTGLMPSPFIFRFSILWSLASFFLKHSILKNSSTLCKRAERSFFNIENRPSNLCGQFFLQLSQKGHREAWLNGAYNSFTGGKEFQTALSTIHVPTMILWGEHDKTIPVLYAKKFQKLILKSKIKTFSLSAHSIPLEQPTEFCEVITTFCKK